MSLSLKTQLKLIQKLSMTTELQQSIKLLSLNHQEMKERIQEELLENPVLQTEEDHQQEERHSSSGENHLQERQRPLQDWVESLKVSSYRSLSQERKNPENTFETFLSKPVTLDNHLLWQAQTSGLPEDSKTLLAVLIFDLDERGYLTSSLEELAQKEQTSVDKLELVLKVLQNMDPIGVGARDIKECLLIQARYLEEDTKDMMLIINNHLKDLENKNYKLISSHLNISIEEVLDLCKIIQSMEPIPAQNFSVQPTEYITPDVYIYKEGGEYKVSLNEEGVPILQIDNHYKKMLNQSKLCKSDMKTYIREKIQAGDWFIRSLLQRQETIKKVVKNIVERQKDFLDQGFLHLKPLVLKDVAEDISVHISTVSRATSNKYAYTPQGLIPLKDFFNIGVFNTNGEAVSISVIKYRIKEWIEQENQKEPLSDGDLVSKLMAEMRLSLSRRTVAQYRDSIGIPPFSKRKLAV